MGNTLIRLLSRLNPSFQLTVWSRLLTSVFLSPMFLCVDSQKIKCYEDYGQWHWGDATLSPTIAQSSAAVTSERKTLTWQDRPLVWGKEWSHRCLHFPNVPPPVRVYVYSLLLSCWDVFARVNCKAKKKWCFYCRCPNPGQQRHHRKQLHRLLHRHHHHSHHQSFPSPKTLKIYLQWEKWCFVSFTTFYSLQCIKKVFFQDHQYALDPVQAKKKLAEAQERIEELQRELRNSKDRERRLKKTVMFMITELKSKNNLPPNLQSYIDIFSGWFNCSALLLLLLV